MAELKQVMPFAGLANGFEDSIPLYAYYLRKYAVEKVPNRKDCFGYQIFSGLRNTNPEAAKRVMAELNPWMTSLQQIKKQLGASIDLQPNIAQLTEYTDKLFLMADDQYRSHNFTPELTQNFQTALRFYELIGSLRELSQDENKRRVYAKSKAIQVFKALKQKKQEPPQPPAYVPEPPKYTPQPPSNYQPSYPPSNPQPNQYTPPPAQYNPTPQAPSYGGYGEEPKKTKTKVDPERILAQNQAITQLQNAISELSFNRVSYAKQAIRNALMLIDRYN